VIIELVSGKGRSWEYEKEWRVISEKANVELQFPWKISSVIFGFRMKPRMRNLVRKICDFDVVFKEVIPLPGTYDVEVK